MSDDVESFCVGLPVVAEFRKDAAGRTYVSTIAVDITELGGALREAVHPDDIEPEDRHVVAADALCDLAEGWINVHLGAPEAM